MNNFTKFQNKNINHEEASIKKVSNNYEEVKIVKNKTLNKIFNKLIALLILLIFLGLPFLIHYYFKKSIGHVEAGLIFLKKCPEAVEALGEPIKDSLFYSYGNARSSGSSFANASWIMKVNGAKSSGIYNFNLIRLGNNWNFLNGNLKINNKIIDIGKCMDEAASNENISKIKSSIIETLKKSSLSEEEVNKLIEEVNKQYENHNQ